MTTQLLPTVPDRTRPRLVLGGLGAAYVVALAAVYVLTVRTVPGRLVSDASLRGALSTRSAASDSVHAVLDVVSVGSLAVATAVVVVIALLRLAGRAAVVAIGLLAAANVSTWLLKNYLFSRPALGLREAGPETLNSLPSGHATAAFSGAAFCVVGFWSVVAAWVVLRGSDQAVPGEDRWRPPGRTARIALVGVGAGTAVSVLLALLAHDSTGTLVTLTALLGGVLLVVGGAFAAMLGILRAVDLAGTGR